jgi:hypothetical protein
MLLPFLVFFTALVLPAARAATDFGLCGARLPALSLLELDPPGARRIGIGAAQHADDVALAIFLGGRRTDFHHTASRIGAAILLDDDDDDVAGRDPGAPAARSHRGVRAGHQPLPYRSRTGGGAQRQTTGGAGSSPDPSTGATSSASATATATPSSSATPEPSSSPSSAETATAGAKSAASSTIVKFKRSVGRRNFKFEKVEPIFRPYDQDYRESMIMLSFPGFGLAFLALLTGTIFGVMRGCRGKCGGPYPSSRGYTGLQRNLPRATIFLGFLVILACAGLGYTGNVGVRSSLRSFFSEILLGVTSTTALTEEVVGILARAEKLANASTANTTERYDLLLAEAATTRTVTDNIQRELSAYDDIRFILINIFFAAAVIMIVLAMLSALCGAVGCTATLSIWLGFASLVALWCTFAVHLPTSIMLADLCPAIDEFVASPDAVRSPSISVWVQCFQNDSFSDVFEIASTGLVVSLDDLNTFSVAQGLGVAVAFNRTAALPETSGGSSNATAGTGAGANSAAAAAGGNGTGGSNSSTIIITGDVMVPQIPSIDAQLLDYEIKLLDLLDSGQIEDVEPYYAPLSTARLYSRTLRKADDLRTCEIAKGSFDNVKATLCVEMLTEMDFVLGAAGMAASMLIFVTWAEVLGKKRFDPKAPRRGEGGLVPLDDDNDDDVAAANGGAAQQDAKQRERDRKREARAIRKRDRKAGARVGPAAGAGSGAYAPDDAAWAAQETGGSTAGYGSGGGGGGVSSGPYAGGHSSGGNDPAFAAMPGERRGEWSSGTNNNNNRSNFNQRSGARQPLPPLPGAPNDTDTVSHGYGDNYSTNGRGLYDDGSTAASGYGRR